MFLKSLRLANFSLFVTCLKEIIISKFSLDHTHYERWMLVFIEDPLDLPFMHENIYVFLEVILQ